MNFHQAPTIESFIIPNGGEIIHFDKKGLFLFYNKSHDQKVGYA